MSHILMAFSEGKTIPENSYHMFSVFIFSSILFNSLWLIRSSVIFSAGCFFNPLTFLLVCSLFRSYFCMGILSVVSKVLWEIFFFFGLRISGTLLLTCRDHLRPYVSSTELNLMKASSPPIHSMVFCTQISSASTFIFESKSSYSVQWNAEHTLNQPAGYLKLWVLLINQ